LQLPTQHSSADFDLRLNWGAAHTCCCQNYSFVDTLSPNKHNKPAIEQKSLQTTHNLRSAIVTVLFSGMQYRHVNNVLQVNNKHRKALTKRKPPPNAKIHRDISIQQCLLSASPIHKFPNFLVTTKFFTAIPIAYT